MERSDDHHKITDLCCLLAQIRNPGDIQALLEDLCTAKELENMAERCYAAKLLLM